MRTPEFQAKVEAAKASLTIMGFKMSDIKTMHVRDNSCRCGQYGCVRGFDKNPKGGKTVRILVDLPNQVVHSAVAICRSNENFDKKLANDICLIRLVNQIHLQKQYVINYMSETFIQSEIKHAAAKLVEDNVTYPFVNNIEFDLKNVKCTFLLKMALSSMLDYEWSNRWKTTSNYLL